MSVRNSYSRKRRTTASRSYSPTRPRSGSSTTSTSRTRRISSRLSRTRLAVLRQERPQLLGRHLVEVLVQRVERAPRGDQLRRRLLPHPGDARDVVRGVALERLVVQHLVRPQAPALVDLREVVGHRVGDAAAEGDHQPRALADQLEHVQVAGEDRHLEAGGLRLARERRDHVVGLEALPLVDRDAQGLDHLADLRDLLPHVVGHPRPGGLVLRVALVAEGRLAQVEGDRDVVGVHVRDRPQHDVREAEHGRDQLALRGRQGLVDEREVAAVDEPVAVEQQEAFHRPRACGLGQGQCSRAVADQVPSSRSRSASSDAMNQCCVPALDSRTSAANAVDDAAGSGSSPTIARRVR